MQNIFIESSGDEQKAYESVLLDPKAMVTITSDLAMRIIAELVKQPCCAMDLGRKLNEHEQKIYYHLRRLEQAGIIKIAATENRYGMTAKIYDVVSPVVAAKLYDGGFRITSANPMNKTLGARFLNPFIIDGRLNSKIIIGDPNPHGKYEKGSRDGPYVTDLSMFMGNFLSRLELPCYKLDSQIKDSELGNNMILIGSPQVNAITEKMNPELPIYFNGDCDIVSKLTGKTYDEDFAGVVVKCSNPFNKNAKIMLIAGKRSAGTLAAIKAVINHFIEIMEGNTAKKDFVAKVVMGTDKDSDGIIDHVNFLE